MLLEEVICRGLIPGASAFIKVGKRLQSFIPRKVLSDHCTRIPLLRHHTIPLTVDIVLQMLIQILV